MAKKRKKSKSVPVKRKFRPNEYLKQNGRFQGLVTLLSTEEDSNGL